MFSLHFCRSASLAFALAALAYPQPSFAADENSGETKSKDKQTSKSSSADDSFSSTTLHAQILLDRILISPGAIDGLDGTNAARALRTFQLTQKLEASGKIDDETSAALVKTSSDLGYLSTYEITEEDASAPLIDKLPDNMKDQADLKALGYESREELLAEKFHCSVDLLKRLNPGAKYQSGDSIVVPNIVPTDIRPFDQKTKLEKAFDDSSEKSGKSTSSEKSEEAEKSDSDSKTSESIEAKGVEKNDTPQRPSGIVNRPKGDVTVIVTKEDSGLSLIDSNGKLLFHAPVSAGSKHDPLPLGDWKINGTEKYPKYHYNPELFWDAEKSDEKAVLPAGPNGPVGVAWIDISKPHYGIHGTSHPEKIGYTESHGCVRLTNWDVLRLADLVKPGTKVKFLETEEEGTKLITPGNNPLLEISETAQPESPDKSDGESDKTKDDESKSGDDTKSDND